jgi:SAM-dependent methyltransferase
MATSISLKLEWTRILSDVYEDAVYRNPLLTAVYERELDYMRDILKDYAILVEVGCGTCKFCSSFIDTVSHVVGVDISEEFLEFARQRSADAFGNLTLVNGDATNLENLVRNEKQLPLDFWARRKVVCCVMNTLGIMPDSIRLEVLREMVKVTGDNGHFFLAVFNGDHFRRGVEEFYRTVPHLCGDVQDSDVNYETTELNIAETGYYSHWFAPAKLEKLVVAAGLRDYRIEQHGIGLFVTSPPIKPIS